MFARSGSRRQSTRGGRRGGKGGFALVAGAAGFAYKNRHKLMARFGQSEGRDTPPATSASLSAVTRGSCRGLPHARLSAARGRTRLFDLDVG